MSGPALDVSFIGLGVMGFPMAGHLARAGHHVTVYNRTASKAKAWVERFGGKAAPTPAQAADGSVLVFACVGNDDDLRDVVLGKNGAFAAMKPGAIFVDHTTASAKVERELAAQGAERGIELLDAPVSGGQSGAENGTLAIMVGGKPEVFAKAEPVMAAYGRMISLIGPVGAGQLTKMVNQICIGGLVQALAEGLSFAQKAGLDVARVVSVISKGAASSWQMENRWKPMVEGKFDFGFAVNWMRKDLAICLDEARNNGAQLPVTALVDQFYGRVQKLGGARWDTCSLIKLLADT
jgi:3-hydroxyisobutyrate dehydrogenase